MDHALARWSCRRLIPALLLIMLVAVDALALDLAKLQADLGAYRDDLTAIADKSGAASGQLQPLFVMYLADNQTAATLAREFVARNPAELPVVKELEKLNQQRLTRKNRMLQTIPPSAPEFPFLRDENKSWQTHLYPYLEDTYVKGLVVRKQLYEFKYFEADDPKQANLAEAWLNGAIPFTRQQDEPAWYRQHGVSSWEATLRVEPLVLLEDHNRPGALATAGMLYNFFPEVSAQDGENRFQPLVKHDFWSRNLKRAGLKLGAGALFDDPKTEFLAGVGLQLRVWSLWGVYSTGESRYSLAVSLSDWDWVKKLLPLFQ